MRRRNDPSVEAYCDATILRRVGDVLRHISQPARLRDNPITARFFGPASSPTRREDDAAALRRIREAVDVALERISSRQRTIIERCDFGGERHAVVYQALGISEAHFYRERRRALGEVNTQLEAQSAGTKQSLHTLPDSFAVAMAYADALEQVGQFDGAITALTGIAEDVDSAVQRTRVYVRLAEICAKSGRYRDAARYADIALLLTETAAPGDDGLAMEAAVALAVTLHLNADEAAIDKLSRRIWGELRITARETAKPSVRRAFARVALIVAIHASERGRTSNVIDLCTEALGVLDENCRADASMRFEVAHIRAFARMYSRGTFYEGLHELEVLMNAAVEKRLMIDGAGIAGTLAGAYCIAGQPKKAIELLSPAMLHVARESRLGSYLGAVLIARADAQLRIGCLGEALRDITEVREYVEPRSVYHALSYVLEAEARLLQGEPAQCLRAAHETIELMTRLGRWRYVGSGLRLQALALEALGNRKKASVSISAAVEYLETFSNEYSMLRAKVDAARLSGNLQQSQTCARQLALLDRSEYSGSVTESAGVRQKRIGKLT